MPDPAADAPLSSARLPPSGNGGGVAQLLPMAAFLATVTTIYLVMGYLIRTRPGWPAASFELAYAWVAQFVVSWAMLALVAMRYRQLLARGRVSARSLVGVIVACALVGVIVQSAAVFLRAGAEHFRSGNLLGHLLWNLCLATLVVLAYHFAERSRHAQSSLVDAEVLRIGLERELASTQLQLLQAQVEPHFIFNALANVRRLLRTDAEAARTLLADLLRYLEEALPRLRDEPSTLGREAELVRAYLAVYQVRMGPRLRTEVDVPAALAGYSVPSMVLLTLVENALKHGLQPMVDGGTLRVAAREAQGRLTLTVADTGHGMGSGSGHGTGLANLRARLKSMYGAAASLTLEVNEPRGVVATVVLPV